MGCLPKINISCAVTGSIHTPSMAPHLPVTARQTTEQATDAAKAGAAILHFHARDPKTGRLSAAVDDVMAFLPAIKNGTDAVVNLTTGGCAVMPLEERLAGPKAAQPEMCSLNMGSTNFAPCPMLGKRVEWLREGEEPILRNSDDLVVKNTPRDIAGVSQTMGRERGAKFNFECYEIGHLHMLRQFVDHGLGDGPIFNQFVMVVLGGTDADTEHFMHLKQTADRMFGDAFMFSVLASGRMQLAMAAMSASMGGHVRVGLADSLHIAKGQLARSNAEHVARVRGIVEALGREVATADEVGTILGLKGQAEVAF